MTFGSLFAGIGGMDLGLERAGLECRWQVEINPFSVGVLRHHWPNVTKYGDIREIRGTDVERVDLIAGGFPCQDISYAGKGAGLSGERSGLWAEFARLIREMGPRYVLVENVAGLLDRGMGDVLGTLAEIGYDAEWDCIPAAAFGLPHIRDRVFIVAYHRGTKQGPIGLRKLRESETIDWKRLVLPGRVRNIYGVPDWVDRVTALGNAVVPQVAEWIGSRILQAHSESHR